MATSSTGEISPLSTESKWSDTAVHLKDFASKFPLPNVVKVTKGQYRNIGVSKTVHNELYIHSISASKKVLAEGIKLKDGRRSMQTIDQKFSLPLSYQGWFELLSEDGKPIKAILSVQELVKIFPNKCLVRENIKGFIPKENGELSVEKARVVHTGEQLTLTSEISAPFTTPKGVYKKKILKCVDLKEEPVFFLLEQKGLFSPIAGSGNISGVHNIKGLLEKFRLPIMVRLVHGIIPTRMDKNSFTGVFRIFNLYSDETAFVSPLKRDSKMIPISTREPIKVIAASNFDNLRDIDDSKYFNQRCTRMIASYNNSIHIMVNMPDQHALERGKQELRLLEHERQRQVEQNRLNGLPQTEENILFEEVDDIYQYVRDGGPPPPPRPRPGQNAPAIKGWRLSSSQNKKEPDKKDKRDKKDKNVKKTEKTKKSSGEKYQALPVATGPIVDRSQDEGYWEEPIYDDIEKFQRRRSHENLLAPELQTSKESGDKTVKSTFASKLAKFANLSKDSNQETSPPRETQSKKNPERSFSLDNAVRDQNGNRNSDGDKYRSSDSLNRISGSPNHTKNTQDVAEYIKGLQVTNLRQMYKGTSRDDNEHGHSESRPGSYSEDKLGGSNDNIVDKNSSPFVLTGKRFEPNAYNSNDSIPSRASHSSTESADGSKPAEVKVVPNRNIVTVSTPVNISHGQQLANNAKVNIILPTSPQQQQNSSIVQSQQSNASSHMIYNRTSNQISISTPTKLPQQKYVAVARVGGPDNPRQVSANNSASNKVTTSGSKIQSMYL